jgi:hypothetical protein
MKRGSRNGISRLDDRLFIGSEIFLRLSLETVRGKLGITHLLSCNGYKPGLPDFETLVLDIDDEEDEDIMKHFDTAIDFIEQARGKVFIFCTVGRSRSATILTAYLMKTRKLTAEQALETIREVRDVQPNPGFLRQLKQYEEILSCELCRLERTTDWYIETPDYVVIACDQCDLPMVVLRKHTMEVEASLKHQMQSALESVAEQYFKGKAWHIDTKQRTIYTHMHWHAREQGYKL